MSFGNPSQQRGITLISMVLVGIVIATIGALTAKIVPTVSEYYTVLRSAASAAARSPPSAKARGAPRSAPSWDMLMPSAAASGL